MSGPSTDFSEATFMQVICPRFITTLATAVAAIGLATAPPVRSAVTPLSNTSWNFEHMMSEKTFDEWSAFCVKYGWDEDKVKAASASKPKHLTYCNAHNGALLPTTIPEPLPLHNKVAFEQKVNALRKRRAELNSDIFALQEVENESAMRRVFPESEWDVIVTSADIS